jgi:hypothetical protein
VLIDLKKTKVFKSLKDDDEEEMMGMGMMG